MVMDFDEVIDRRNTYSSQWDYISDRFGRDDILPFSLSDTDFKCPKEVIMKLKTVTEFGIYGYTRWNNDDFINSIKGYYNNFHNSSHELSSIAYSPAVIFSISLLFDIISNPKDKVCVFNPMYDAFFNLIENNNRELNSCNLIYHNKEYNIDFNEFEEKIKESKVFLLCSPHNPTGKVFTREEIKEIIRICEKYNVWIISDEIHSDLIHKGSHFPLFSDETSYTKLIIVSSASKTFNTPALIGSYVVFKDNLICDMFINDMRNKYFLNSASLMGITALMTSYNDCKYYVDELNEYIYNNYIYAKNRFHNMNSKIEVTELESTYLMWVKFDQLCDTEILKENLINYGKVGIMHGSTYGDNRFFRINIGCPRSKLIEGMDRIEKTLKYLKIIE